MVQFYKIWFISIILWATKKLPPFKRVEKPSRDSNTFRLYFIPRRQPKGYANYFGPTVHYLLRKHQRHSFILSQTLNAQSDGSKGR